MPGKKYTKRNRAEAKAIKKIVQARLNIKMADELGVKPHKPSVRTIKQAERQESKAKAKAKKNLKKINKKPLPPRSRSGVASGRVGGGLRGGRLGGGGAMNWSTK